MEQMALVDSVTVGHVEMSSFVPILLCDIPNI